MAIATKPKPKNAHQKKRTAAHHRQSKQYVKSYWPYLPMAALMAAGIFVNGLLNHPQAVLGAHSNLSEQALLEATNLQRTDNMRSNLVLDNELQTAAQAKAEDMVARDYWAHQTPDGKQPWQFLTTVGYQYQTAGENLAFGFDTANAVTNAWMHSDEHRANLLDTTYSQVGFGVAQSPNYMGHGTETVVVAMYASPAGSITVPVTTIAPTDEAPVSRLQAATPALSGFLVGVIGSMAVIFVLIRHGIAWRKLVSRGELFVIHHPILDIAFVTLAILAVLVSRTAGFIY